MPSSGRANWLLIALCVAAAAIVGLVFFSGESPLTASNRFMLALADGDAQELADMSFFTPDRPRDQKVADWEKTIDRGKYYRFTWRVTTEQRPSDDRATVKMLLARNFFSGQAYEEDFSLDLVKVNGKWLVDVRGMNRSLYPALPK